MINAMLTNEVMPKLRNQTQIIALLVAVIQLGTSPMVAKVDTQQVGETSSAGTVEFLVIQEQYASLSSLSLVTPVVTWGTRKDTAPIRQDRKLAMRR